MTRVPSARQMGPRQVGQHGLGHIPGFRAFGLTVPTARRKVDGMANVIPIARGLWSQPGFSYAGRVYHTDSADVAPRPEHRIPIWLGTFGDRALAVTGRLADGWISSLSSAPPDQVTVLGDKLVAAAVASRTWRLARSRTRRFASLMRRTVANEGCMEHRGIVRAEGLA
ncbi:LLM class flavin-dependent oxidoreductase [Micromonospora phytophila]|uniref:LLM class flavin-dependent oxidoreductase n=1 Tax=Micromonospora phytophila TaxID=709888 RepID=UPI003557DB51